MSAHAFSWIIWQFLCKAAFRHLNYPWNYGGVMGVLSPLLQCTLLSVYTTVVLYYCLKDSQNYILYMYEYMIAVNTKCSKGNIYKSNIKQAFLSTVYNFFCILKDLLISNSYEISVYELRRLRKSKIARLFKCIIRIQLIYHWSYLFIQQNLQDALLYSRHWVQQDR